ncbi:uncharacterized protein LOC123316977 isoform X2 [Coccinella septempunctata]|nr:uncharacterized protein LOC123316977 isoform X2 [Coccinella septempunctata]
MILSLYCTFYLNDFDEICLEAISYGVLIFYAMEALYRLILSFEELLNHFMPRYQNSIRHLFNSFIFTRESCFVATMFAIVEWYFYNKHGLIDLNKLDRRSFFSIALFVWFLGKVTRVLPEMKECEKDKEIRSEKSEKIQKTKCAHCRKTVTRGIKCTECEDIFHYSCLKKSANQNQAICKHVGQSQSKDEENHQNKILSVENSYLKELLKAVKDKNQILITNNQLLLEKIELLETEKNRNIKSLQPIEVKKKPSINTKDGRQQIQENVPNPDKLHANEVELHTNEKQVITVSEQSSSVLKSHDMTDRRTISTSQPNLYEKIEIISNTNKTRKETNKQLNQQESFEFGGDEENKTDENTQLSKNRRANIGTARIQKSDVYIKFQSVDPDKVNKKLWLFISRVKASVEKSDIRLYIAEKASVDISEINVQILDTKSEKSFKEFMVGVPIDLEKQIYKNKFWPTGIYFSPFDFARGQHFSEEQASIYNSLRFEEDDGLNYSSAMAHSFFHGYLRLILPKTGGQDKNLIEIIEVYSDKHNVQVFPKLFILVPKSAVCPVSLEGTNIHLSSSLEEKQLTIAGVQKRVYKNSVYKVRDPQNPKQPNYVCAEYATPLRTFFKALEASGKYNENFKKHQDDIVLHFYLTTRDLVMNDPDISNLCELIYYDDRDEKGNFRDVAPILLRKIRKRL